MLKNNEKVWMTQNSIQLKSISLISGIFDRPWLSVYKLKAMTYLRLSLFYLCCDFYQLPNCQSNEGKETIIKLNEIEFIIHSDKMYVDKKTASSSGFERTCLIIRRLRPI